MTHNSCLGVPYESAADFQWLVWRERRARYCHRCGDYLGMGGKGKRLQGGSGSDAFAGSFCHVCAEIVAEEFPTRENLMVIGLYTDADLHGHEG